jgi:transcriptional regulator with XRE-family HTH domain
MKGVNIGTNLKALRLQAGLTQVQLSKASGVSQGTITGYEHDLQRPSAEKLAALAKALGVAMEALVPLDAVVSAQASGDPFDNRVHGNSCTAQLVKLVPQLDLDDQRALLKQAKLMLLAKTTPKRRNKAA